jgi:hypothetical protein
MNILAECISLEMIISLERPYRRIVKKCINNDIGEGSGLAMLGLQAVFYKDMICGLESLENRSKELHIDK